MGQRWSLFGEITFSVRINALLPSFSSSPLLIAKEDGTQGEGEEEEKEEEEEEAEKKNY